MNAAVGSNERGNHVLAGAATPIAREAMQVARKVDYAKLRRQLLRGSLTCILSFIGTVVILLTLILGPTLQQNASVFLLFVLFLLIALFAVALMTTASALISGFAYERLRTVRSEVDSLDLMEEYEKAVQIFREIQQSSEKQWPGIIKKHKDDISIFCAK